MNDKATWERQQFTPEQKVKIVQALTTDIGASGVCRKHDISNALYCQQEEHFFEGELVAWAKRRGALLHFTTLGRPMESGFRESLNAKIRQECLNDHQLVSLAHAAREI